MAKSWNWCITKAYFISRDQVEGFVERMQSFTSGYLIHVMATILYAVFTCILALGGAVVGGMKGQTTETGLVKGSAIGAVAVAITALHFLDSKSDNDLPLSKVDMLYSLMNGNALMELLKAYQWEISSMESIYREISNIYDTNGNNTGLSNTFIQTLPRFTFHSISNLHESCCSICLQDFKDGELMRILPYCQHFFHLDCLDKWLSINGSCPFCRNNISDDFLF